MPACDIVLKNAHVITMDEANPVAGGVAVKGNKIFLVGDDEVACATAGAGTRVIDCQGKTVVPGFNDAHCHIFSFVRKLLSLDLSPSYVSSIVDIKKAVKRQAEKTPEGRWISGTGYSDFYLAEKRHPTRRELDEAAPYHPVVLSHAGLHVCVLNSLALSLAGIGKDTPSPPGTLIERDAIGEPKGILHEMLGYIREKVMPPLTEEEITRGMSLANEHYLSQGITSLQDATIVNDLSRWRFFRRLTDNGVFVPRVYMMFGGEHTTSFKEVGLSSGSGDEALKLGGVKIILTESTGSLYPGQDEMNEQVLRAQKAGFPVAIHAIGEESVAAAITAFEYAKKQSPALRLRHRIEHGIICPPSLLERLRRLKVVVATQPPFVHFSGDRYLANTPEAQKPWLYPFRSLIASGITLAASSDSPIVPDNPLMGIYAAITRKTRTGQLILPHESITAEEALRMYTVNAALASFEENIKGTITPGKLADMVALSANLLESSPEEIKDIKVAMTIADGRVVWEG